MIPVTSPWHELDSDKAPRGRGAGARFFPLPSLHYRWAHPLPRIIRPIESALFQREQRTRSLTAQPATSKMVKVQTPPSMDGGGA